MVQVNIDNNPVSVTLDGGESVTVPTGETWKVTIILYGAGSYAQINGLKVVNADSNNHSPPVETVLTGGDTIKNWSSNGEGLHIGGFVV